MSGSNPCPDDTFKILLTTDNHLGYGEKKPIIDQDSFRTFEEILKLAVKKNVDMILLGGDLFHDVQPTNYTLFKCTELLKKYCLGDRPVAIEFLSDPTENFRQSNPIVNYEDQNMNISIPVFSIHGNHDNPSGAQQVSGLDIISATGLVNYFGRVTDIKNVTITPILLKKGSTKIALYGLSHIPDQRLARLFHEKKVSMLQPEGDDWFNILVLHQNRANRGSKNFIPTSVIPSFIDLVLWGHEHNCDIEPVQLEHGPHITQPGSSVATSLCEGESIEKKIGILRVFNKSFSINPIPLATVRPLMFSSITLKCPDRDEDYNSADPKEQAKQEVRAEVDKLIFEAIKRQELAGADSLMPFVRLFVRYYCETQVFNAIRMGHDYEDRVANPTSMFKLVNMNLRTSYKVPDLPGIDPRIMDEDIIHSGRLDDHINDYFNHPDRVTEMSIYSTKVLTRAVQKCVDSDDLDAIAHAIEMQERATLDKLIELNPTKEDFDDCFKRVKDQRLQDEDKEITDNFVLVN
ncbi:double-strand break repair protein MRE11 isoform X2 [Onthophagus taurus]|uniref:double-strand break repair protein MRE11 isoform X2 n=1 Tax=Onthophagus taurus TaxID=166361 RepID=UPI000C20A5B0|nr:double-strand break repair protein MRE11 isoform X2 [Onthophagus taurus]